MLREKTRHSPEERQRRHRSEGGFTTIEILLVIILIGMLSAVAIARWPSIPKSGPAARRLARDTQYAKQLANRLQTRFIPGPLLPEGRGTTPGWGYHYAEVSVAIWLR